MANLPPILCVVGSEDEASEFRKALVELGIVNPLRCVTGALEAMSCLESAANSGQGPFLLVFLSLAAPDANQLAAWFEGHPQERPAGLIAMTGFTDMRPIIQAYHLGVTAFLQWPLKPKDIRNALHANPSLKLDQRDSRVSISRL